MPDDTSSPPFKSSYAPIERPDFKPSVPDFLLEGASEQDRYIISQLSLVNQYAQWSVNTEMLTHDQVLRTNGRLLRAESDIKKTRGDLEDLKAKAAVAEPLLKPLAQFMALWEYRAFRWVFYVAGFFLITYVLPAYIAHPISLSTFFTLLFGP